ncbi:hypothetical protein LTR70_007072 [Exophiala xenobiotica]|uniref:Uncharacterized protein n=1 Tax=Lithohypha guttulata TaxID=1690604 RepID=A0ABR0K6K7_9EURO|nr:hypothetical protein LTR24_006293 [Lithohypha guttulata]KAK5314635.1 hypothetical protein LTR70_007072 [Exophiala xenobiotica]
MRRAASPSPSSFSLLTLLLTLLLLTTPIHALNQPTSYCKCICFQNSTIIPLNSPPSTSASPSSNPLLSRTENNDEKRPEPQTSRDQKHHELTCNDCNRAFCLDYNLPVCKDAKEEDVFAQCFQRDSLKDRTIVTVFILATASLLGWALVKPFIVKSGVGDVMGRYTSISVNTGGNVDGDGLPGPNGRLMQGSHGGEGGSGSRRVGRGTGGAGGRGSVSRQGGLNS